MFLPPLESHWTDKTLISCHKYLYCSFMDSGKEISGLCGRVVFEIWKCRQSSTLGRTNNWHWYDSDMTLEFWEFRLFTPRHNPKWSIGLTSQACTVWSTPSRRARRPPFGAGSSGAGWPPCWSPYCTRAPSRGPRFLAFPTAWRGNISWSQH